MVSQLGQGGMATVWKARQVSLDRTGRYALKVPRGRIDIGVVDTAKRLVVDHVDLTGVEESRRDFDLRLR